MANKKVSPVRKQNITRIKRFIRETEKRGYRYSDEFKTSLTNLTTNQLKSLTPDKLYKKATALSIEGHIISGTQRRKEEQQESKSRKTKSKKPTSPKATKSSKNARKEYYETAGTGRTPAKDSSATITDIILQNIEELVDKYYDSDVYSYKSGARMLRKALTEEISEYGRPKVARSCEEAPEEAKHYAEVVVFSSLQEQKIEGLATFMMIIRGTTLSIEEAKDIGEAMENMEQYDLNED